jgi:hypothetical protein
VKLSDDEIEEAFTRSATVVERYFTRSAILWAFCHTNRRFEFHKRSQLFIGTHNETLPVAAMCVRNPGRSGASAFYREKFYHRLRPDHSDQIAQFVFDVAGHGDGVGDLLAQSRKVIIIVALF